MVLPGVVDLGLGGMQMGWGHQDRGPWSLPLISLAAFWVLKLTDKTMVSIMLPGGSPCTPRACTTLVPTSHLKKWSPRGHHTVSRKSWWPGSLGLSAGLQGIGRGNGWGPPIEVQVRCSPQNPRPPVALVGIRLSQIPTRHLGPCPQAPAPPRLGCCPLL